jgi:Putative zinc dependent peptidase (DUF5700)
MPALILAAILSAPNLPAELPRRVEVSFDSGEADAVLAILGKRRAAIPVRDSDWNALFASEGFRRLEAREAAMKRPFSRDEFRRFVESDELSSKADALAATLAKWKTVDVAASADRALAYLPPGSPIRATIFPEIKPRPNSFVFSEPSPAIFLAVDPKVGPERLANTLAHELHHIGIAAGCREERKDRDEKVEDSQPLGTATKWLSAFGEGLAMLAAAGGPNAHPHAASPPEERARWDRDMRSFDRDLETLDGFFREVLSGKLAGEAADERGFTFFGVQGPWYTVGYRMSVAIEKAFGRDALVRDFCDPRTLPEAYNAAADRLGIEGARWSQTVVRGLARPPHDRR